jgi:hypothetical protein
VNATFGTALMRHNLSDLVCSSHLLHAIESRSGFEPGDLWLVKSMVQLDVFCASVTMLQGRDNLCAGRKFGKAIERDLVVGLDLVIVSLVVKGQREHALLLEVGLVDPGKGLDYDGMPSEESWLECGMLS